MYTVNETVKLQMNYCIILSFKVMQLTLFLMIVLLCLQSSSSRKTSRARKCYGRYTCDRPRSSGRKIPCMCIDKDMVCDGYRHCPLGDDENNCSCTVLSNPTNGKVFHGGFRPGAVSNYTCDIGFKLSTNASRTCQLDGSWNSSQPFCTSIVCPTLSDIANGIVTATTNLVLGVATYNCSIGYSLNGASTRVCREQGLWSGDEPVCKSPDCPLLHTPQNGQVTYEGLRPGNGANYQCDVGFVLSLEETRTCEIGGSWSGTSPSCSAIVCQTLGNPENGVLSIDELSIGGKAKYSCNSGFAIMGTDERVCLKSGVWTGVAPSCLEIPSLNAYGTEFTTAFGTNSIPAIPTELSIIMVSTEEVTVTIESPFLASDIIVTFTDIHKEIFTTGLEHAPTTGSENKGVHISSTGRIAVFSSSFHATTADAHLVYPDEILFNNYVVSTFPSAIANNKEEFVIVGTVNLTQVTIDIPEQSQIIFHLNRLQSFQYQGVGLSGTHITATENVVVISSHECANVPNDATGVCDFLVDQMLPINKLQKAFIVSYMFPRPTFTIQLISPEDATVIKIHDAEGIQLEMITLNQGESEILDFSDKDIISIIATNGIIVSQYTHGKSVEPIPFGDPSSTSVPGIIQYDNNYIFGTIDQFPTHFVSIIMHTAYDFNDLHLDGQSVGGYPKLPITVPEWGTYKVMYVPVYSGRHTLTHKNTNANYGTILYGYKGGAMYAFPVGMRL